MTFSIAARCAKTGMFGIAISSSSPAVAARCSHARAGAGIVASQNITDPSLGISGLAGHTHPANIRSNPFWRKFSVAAQRDVRTSQH